MVQIESVDIDVVLDSQVMEGENGIYPADMRQFSKQPYLEISTDLPENGIIKVPLQVE